MKGTDIKRIDKRIKQLFRRHPISSILLVFYLLTSLFRGNMGLFLAGLLAAAGAFGLEAVFHVTGAIGMQRSRPALSAERNVQDRESRKPWNNRQYLAAGMIQPDHLSGARIITIRRRAY